MRRSNRLVLLIGVFLAIVAFVGIILLAQGGGGTGPNTGKATPPPPQPVVVAAVDIPLSVKIRPEQVTTKLLPVEQINSGAYQDISQVVGQVARAPIVAGGQVTQTQINPQQGVITNLNCPVGLRCMAVQVDQVSGVGTVIKTGDYVDMVVGIAADKFPVITINPQDNSVQVLAGLNNTSVKLLLQGLQVMGTLLPPVAPPANSGTASPPPTTTAGGPTTLNGQSQIVILAATAQQAEVIKFSQLDGSVTLALRSPDDFIDPATGQPLPPLNTETTGVTLKVLVDSYGVLPPELVQTVTPAASRKP